jgi:hypothetical protein
MPANAVLGYSFARFDRSSVKMKPTPMTRFIPSAASNLRPASRSAPSPGSMNRMLEPSILVALSAPA